MSTNPEAVALRAAISQFKACDQMLVQAALNCRMAGIAGTANVLTEMAARNRNIVRFAESDGTAELEPIPHAHLAQEVAP